MTDYARYHVDECCLAFDLSIRGKVEERYHRECFLNRDKALLSTLISCIREKTENLMQKAEKKLIRDTVMEEARVLDGLPTTIRKHGKNY